MPNLLTLLWTKYFVIESQKERKKERKKEEGTAQYPLGFEPTTFQFSDCPAGTQTAVLQPMPSFLRT